MWSPNDTKAKLIEVARSLGLDVSFSMLKSEIIEALEETDKLIPDDMELEEPAPEVELEEPEAEPEPEVSVEEKEEAYKTDASYTGDPKLPLPDKPKPPAPKKVAKNVLSVVSENGGKALLDLLVKELGSGAINEAKDLVKRGKLAQHKKASKFWYVLNR